MDKVLLLDNQQLLHIKPISGSRAGKFSCNSASLEKTALSLPEQRVRD